MNVVEAMQKKLDTKKVTTNETVLEQHSGDESYHTEHQPEAVAFPENAQEVSDIIKVAGEYNKPVVPFGVASSLEGSVIPYDSGVVIDFSEMNQILEVKEEDFLVRVQPGVTLSQLNQELKKYGLFFPVDPGADATLGGMAATNASGTMSVRYGIMRDQVRSLEVVLADGAITKTGSLAVKSSSGYDLNGLLIGSEGTLGCFTELTLQVTGIPEKIVAGRASFLTVDDAVEAVQAIKQSGIQIARVELVDAASIEHINWFSETEYREEATLFLEFHGNEAGLAQDRTFVEDILRDFKCQHLEFEADTAGRNRLWEARHKVLYAYVHGHPGKRLMITDVCVPTSTFAGAIKDARDAVDASGLTGGIAGHAGDGNYHIFLMIDVETEMEKAIQLNEHIVDYALIQGGTCTGEHGVGIGKKKYQEREHGASLKMMQAIKKAIDPQNIMNPGKVL
ncbi:MAG TPA: FAD-linked oxidase C-terminal domain-containing protein [Pseudogracilibacillus sp.]|nr:FAD-linked oxidase C-terminal domain-containing protein [Pseudogracilibacillus sp.]